MSSPLPHRAFLGLGSNLDQPAARIEAAIEAIARVPGVTLLKRSSLFGSAPVGFAEQPDFINAVVEVDTTLSAEALLDGVLQIERAAGRVRGARNGPRTLDIDLLLYADQRIDLPTLCVPHPRITERAFVLQPLLEIAPDVLIPGRGSAREYLAGTADQACMRLAR